MKSFDPELVPVRSAHFIGGRYVESNANVLEVLRPSDGRFQATLPLADAEMVDQAAENAWHAFKHGDWASRAPRERARAMRRWADLIEADVAILSKLEAVGSTRPIHAAIHWDIPTTAECLRFFAEFADKIGGDVVRTDTDHFGMTIAEPYGVVGAIAPWNTPLVTSAWKLGPALAAGNAIVLKPSEFTPFSALRLAELAIAAGVPPGIFNVVQGGAVTGDALCRHRKIAKVTFTGSTRTGAIIMAACAQSGIKPVTLELGGKSPQLVFADAPSIDKVARMIAGSITNNGGQVCIAGSRLIVQRAIADQLVGAIADIFRKLKPGHTWDDATTLSPIVSRPQADRIDGLVKRAIEAGAKPLVGGGFCDAPLGGAYYQPTILADVKADAEIVREEVFGPVLTVQTFEDEEEGLELADHPDYGLAAGVHTADIGRAMRAVRAIEAGTVWVNRYGRSGDFMIPTGGYKRSGIGKDLGRQAYESSLKFKSVLIDITKAEAAPGSTDVDDAFTGE